MKYNGQELTPITTPQIFDPPKEMLVWDVGYDEPLLRQVVAITSNNNFRVITINSSYSYCAEIPAPQKPKRATNIQLTEWLMKGNGVYTYIDGDNVYTELIFKCGCEDKGVENIKIRPFGTTEWLEPTLENMGMVNHEQEKEKE